MKATPRTAAAASLLLLLTVQVTQAQTWTNGDGNFNWTDGNNWSSSAPPDANTGTATFTDGTSSGTINLGATGSNTNTLSFSNSSSAYSLGSATTDTLTFGGTSPAITQTGSASNSIGAQIVGSGISTSVSSGTLTLANTANAFSGSFNVSGGASLVAAQGGLGNAANSVTLSASNLTLNAPAGAGLVSGMGGQYWSNQNPPNNTGANTFATTQAGVDSYLASIGTPQATHVLAEVGNGVQGWNGGVNFQNVGYGTGNAFTPIGVNVGTSNVVGDWTATLNVTTPGTYTFSTTSDDASMVFVNGQLIVNNNGGHGAQGASGTFNFAAPGTYSIEVPYTQGGGGWGMMATYQGPGMSSPAAIGVDTPGEISFQTTGLGPVNVGNSINASGASSLTVNSDSVSNVGTVSLADSTNLTVNGSAPNVAFAGTVLSGNSIITNSINVTAGPVSAGTGFSSLTAAGLGSLFLDNTGNTAFTSGTTIHATGAGEVVGVNIGGTNTLGAATLDINGGNFSLGTDGGAQTFANPITLNGGGGTINAQTLGAGTNNNGTVNLTGGIALGGSTLNLNTANGYTIGVNSAITGNGTVNANGNVSIGVANPGFSGNYNINGGTTSENAAGGFGPSAGGAMVTVNNGTTLNMNASGDNLGRGATVNGGGTLNIQATNVDISNTTIQQNGNVNVSQSGTTGSNVNMANGANLNLSGGSPVSFGANMTLAAGALNVNNSGQNFTLSGGVGGAGGLNLNGAGTTTLSGPANSVSYAGTTNLNAGTLALQTNLTGGGQVNAPVGTTLNIGANGSLGTSALNSSGLTTLTANGASLGSGPITIGSNPIVPSTGGQLVFNTGSGNTGNYTGNSITMIDSTLHVSSGSANLNNAVITGNVTVVTPGLLEGRIIGGQTNNINAGPNPGNGGIQPGPLLGYSSNVQDGQPVSAHTWSDNTTWVYTGQINITPNEAANGITFGKSIDDATFLQIDGKTIINDNNWSTPAGAYITGLTAGLHSFQLYMGNGGGGAGWVPDSGFGGAITLPGNVSSSLWAAGTTLGLGFGYADGNPLGLTAQSISGTINEQTISSGGGSLNAMFDNGTGNLFQSDNPGTTISIDAGTSLTAGSIASAQQLNLNGSLTLSSTTANTIGNVVNATVAGPATLNLGANNSFSANSTTITDGNSLTLGGPGRFNVLASQTMAIGSTNSATALNVNGGVFHVDGTVSGPGMVNVNAGGTIGGGGNVGVAVHIGSGGILAPGDAANLTVASLSLADNSTMTYNLNTANVEHLAYSPANGNDLTTVTNSNGLAVSSNAYLFGTDGTTVNVIPGANFGRGTYELLAYTGTFTGSLSSFGIGTAPSQFDYQFVNLLTPGGGQIDLRVTPEPSAVVLLVLGLAGLALGCRRRLAKRAA